MQYNYHTHTYRCGHASGTEREYIERAIQGGVQHMGFSEHMPFRFPDGHESSYRAPVASVEDYFHTLYALREEYKDKIDLKIGFEMEYYPRYFQQMLRNALSWGGEYLILGQHFIREEYPEGIASGYPNEKVEDLKEYVSCVIAGIESGYFTYVAHPDLFYFKGEEEIYIAEMRKICIASRKYDIPLEINFLGIRQNRVYPDPLFWRIAGEEKAPVTFGFDAHNVDSAYDEISLETAKVLVEQYHLNYIGIPKLIILQR